MVDGDRGSGIGDRYLNSDHFSLFTFYFLLITKQL